MAVALYMIKDVAVTTRILKHTGLTTAPLLFYVGLGECLAELWVRARDFRIISFPPCPMILLMNFQLFLFQYITHLVRLHLTLRQMLFGLWLLLSVGPRAGPRNLRGGDAAGLRLEQSS